MLSQSACWSHLWIYHCYDLLYSIALSLSLKIIISSGWLQKSKTSPAVWRSYNNLNYHHLNVTIENHLSLMAPETATAGTVSCKINDKALACMCLLPIFKKRTDWLSFVWPLDSYIYTIQNNFYQKIHFLKKLDCAANHKMMGAYIFTMKVCQ